MEVHHHPHVEKKNFKEYFLEFIMIFLAVTLGFIAENIRENLSNHSKEKEYMQSMADDLKTDTAEIGNAVVRWQEANANTDSLLILLKEKSNPSIIDNLYGLLSRDFFHFNLFKYNNKTIEELKSSGDFRIIRNKAITNKIMSYDLDMKYILIQEQDVKELMNASKNIESKIFDFSQLNDKWGYNKTLHFSYNVQHSLLTDDKQVINEYFNKLWAFHALAEVHENLFIEDKKTAVNLLEQIQENYKLKKQN